MPESNAFFLNIVASASTGGIVIAITNPLDCLKQRWQMAPHSSGMLHFSLDICRREGILRGFWLPGVAANSLACCVSVGTRLGLYPTVRDSLSFGTGVLSGGPGQQGRAGKSGVGMFLSGLLGGATGYLAAAPLFYAARVAHVGAARREPHMPADLGLATLRRLWSQAAGVGDMWLGAPLLVGRGALMSATQLTTYDGAKTALKSAGLLQDGPILHGLCSLLASLTLTTAICPLDCTLTRYQGAERGAYAGPLDCARAMAGAEGPRVFWRGWLPLWGRFLPSSVLTFYIYEQLRHAILGTYLE